MDTFIYGHSDLIEVSHTTTRLRNDTGVIIDAFGTQSYGHPSVGESVAFSSGNWDGFATHIQVNGQWRWEISLPGYRTWLSGIPEGTKWLLLNIESNAGEFTYAPANVDVDDPFIVERTSRALRLLHAIAHELRPELRIANYTESGAMPRPDPMWDQDSSSAGNVAYRKRAARLTYGLKGTTRGTATPARIGSHKVDDKGVIRSQDLVTGQIYLDESWTVSDIDRRVAWFADELKRVRKDSQNIGLWICPFDIYANRTHPAVPPEAGVNWNIMMDERRMSRLGAAMRRSSIEYAIMWGYQSNVTQWVIDGEEVENPSQQDRDAELVRTWNEEQFPPIEAFMHGYI